MSVSSISEIYRSIYASAINKATSSEETTKTTDSTGTANLTDVLELGSSEADLSAYLNYNASGSYSSMPTLVDYLGTDDDGTDLFNTESSSSDSLVDILCSENSDDSDDSISSLFDSMIQAKESEINNLISSALERLGGDGGQTSDDSTNKEGTL